MRILHFLSVLGLIGFNLTSSGNAQPLSMFPDHQFSQIVNDTLRIVSNDIIFHSFKEKTELSYQMSFIPENGPEQLLKTTTIQLKQDEQWIELANSVQLPIVRANSAIKGKFRKTIRSGSESFETEQPVFGQISADGIYFINLVSWVRLDNAKPMKIYRDYFDAGLDSIIIQITGFPHSEKAGDIFNLTYNLSLNAETTISKRTRFQIPGPFFYLDVPVGKLSEAFAFGGRATLELTIFDNERHVLFSADDFSVLIRGTQSTVEKRTAANDPYYLISYTLDEIEELLKVSELFATRDERQLIDQLVSKSDKIAFLTQFWIIRETRKDSWNPTFIQMVERVSAARSLKLEYLGTPYYRTDRGRVLLVYGLPDLIEKEPFGKSSVGTEVWTYDSIENGVSFIFVDFNNSKEYRLVHSTKNGEVYNPNYDSDFIKDTQQSFD